MASASILPGIADAAVISFSISSAGGNRYLTNYTVTGQASDPTISEFTVYFDTATTRNLAVSSSPSGWDSIVIQPDVALASRGFFDALATTAPGVSANNALGGFAVLFDFIGNGVPGAQPFDIVNPSTFASITSGVTIASSGQPLPPGQPTPPTLPAPPSTPVPPTPPGTGSVPEPSILALMAIALAGLAIVRVQK